MQQSSPSVGALAAALAKAQAAIANPEKSLTATIVSPFPREASRTFRYAPLSSGLDLVRKCLGQHEIATVQTTAIDRETNLIRLTTTLVHASGEWVSSDWPVCPISETAAPHRLGAALTYARRYALFTLVGIAGEDDLDAPDLPSGNGASHDHFPAPVGHSLHTSAKHARPTLPPTLSAQDSDVLRRQLASEIERLTSSEALAKWAHRVLPLKNQLSVTDARLVEDLFSTKLIQFENLEAPPNQGPTDLLDPTGHFGPSEQQVTVIGKPVRERDRDHLRFVASQPCLVCGRIPSDAHHIKFAEQTAMGRKVSDKFTVPICRLHHRELHRRGDERVWWNAQGIDPMVTAADLWSQTRKVVEPAKAVLEDKRLGKRNGPHLGPRSLQGRLKNSEPKPILGPEAR
jgi:ERF superfamily